jgi:DnaK suppressor protein
MKAGDYGACEVCSKKIPMARLDALPYATMCIECQRELERNGGMASARDSYDESSADLEIDVS